MCPVVMPGTLIGRLSESIARKTGIGEIPVIAVAGHDTASAVAAVPASSPNFAYLSSGTWSLMGIEVEKPIINEVSFKNNFTNEGVSRYDPLFEEYYRYVDLGTLPGAMEAVRIGLFVRMIWFGWRS